MTDAKPDIEMVGLPLNGVGVLIDGGPPVTEAVAPTDPVGNP